MNNKWYENLFGVPDLRINPHDDKFVCDLKIKLMNPKYIEKFEEIRNQMKELYQQEEKLIWDRIYKEYKSQIILNEGNL